MANFIRDLPHAGKQPNVIDSLRREEESSEDEDAEPPMEVKLPDVLSIKKEKDFGRDPRSCHKNWLVANRPGLFPGHGPAPRWCGTSEGIFLSAAAQSFTGTWVDTEEQQQCRSY